MTNLKTHVAYMLLVSLGACEKEDSSLASARSAANGGDTRPRHLALNEIVDWQKMTPAQASAQKLRQVFEATRSGSLVGVLIEEWNQHTTNVGITKRTIFLGQGRRFVGHHTITGDNVVTWQYIESESRTVARMVESQKDVADATFHDLTSKEKVPKSMPPLCRHRQGPVATVFLDPKRLRAGDSVDACNVRLGSSDWQAFHLIRWKVTSATANQVVMQAEENGKTMIQVSDGMGLVTYQRDNFVMKRRSDTTLTQEQKQQMLALELKAIKNYAP